MRGPADSGAVRQATLTLPTYEEGLPDVNPRFDLFARRPFLIYPYTARTNLTDRRADRTWRTLELENEYLKLVVLPDLGGRIYSCVDKATGAEMFYANPSIKFADVAYRGAWVALGVEFNFPVSHNWATVSPVDFGTVRHEDGSASVWVGNIDRPYGMQWRVELTLRPGRSLLEQTTTLYNRSDVRHRFYWWTTASVHADGDSHILYPMEFSASHYFADVDTWPVDSTGTDLSYPRNHLAGFVSRFAHGSREPFMGVYHPTTETGMVHVADPHDMPGKKIWSWGWDDEGKDWRRALSDDQSAYLEVQAGLFRNQETYAFLEPQQLLRFRETYQPARKIGGWSRANDEGVVHVRRGEGNALRVGLNVTRAVRGGRVVVRDGAATAREDALTLEPSGAFDHAYADLVAPGPYTVEIRDGKGRVLLAHTEGRYDLLPKAEVKTGPQPSHVFPPPAKRSEGDWVELGRHQELNGKLLEAHDVYAAALAAFPDSPELRRAAGRLAVQLKRYDEAIGPLSKAVARRSNDAEALYYLGLAQAALGESQKARFAWDQAATLPAWRAPSLLQLGRLAAREGSGLESAHSSGACVEAEHAASECRNSRPDPRQGLRLVRQALAEAPEMIRAGGMEVALLRRTGQAREAKARLRYWQSIDPPSSFLRHEAVLLGAADEGLWTHLAADPERVLELAVDYMALGLWDDAHALLARRYPAAGVVSEPGMALPQDYPLVAYYRGYCAEKAGRSGREDFALASRQPTRYVFPNRPESLVVLRRAVETNPEDATAHFLLGSLLLSGGQSDAALGEWEKARALDPKLPVLHRNIGFTLLYARGAAEDALRVFEEGMGADPTNVELYQGADQALSLLGRGPDERIAPCAGIPSRRCPRRSSSSWPSRSPKRAVRRGGGALPGALLPPRGVRDERAAGLPRGGAAAGLCPRARGAEGRGGGPRGILRPAGRRVRLYEGRHEGLRRHAPLPVPLRRAAGPAGQRRSRPRALEARGRRARLPADRVRVPRGAEARRGERGRVAPAARDGARRGRPLSLPRGPLPRRRHLRPGNAAARPRPRSRGERSAAAGLRPPGQGPAAPHRPARAPGAIEGGVS